MKRKNIVQKAWGGVNEKEIKRLQKENNMLGNVSLSPASFRIGVYFVSRKNSDFLKKNLWKNVLAWHVEY